MTSDAGLLAYRELDDVLGLTEMAGDVLADARSGKNGRHALAGLFRQSVFGRLAGYEERLRHDRLCAGLSAAKRRRGARLRRIGWGASSRNGSGAQELRCSCRPVWPRSTRGTVLDMSPTHEEVSVWNGHYACPVHRQ